MAKKNFITPILLLVALLIGFGCAKSDRDFEVFVNAGEKLIAGLNLYKPPFALNLQYYYSPFFALLMAPVSYLPLVVAETVWGFLSCVFLYQIWRISQSYFNTNALTQKQKNLWLLLSIIFTARFIRYDMTTIQVTIFLTWATLQSLKFFDREQPITGAALLALAINIKLLPLPFLLYLFYRRQFLGASLTCVFYVAYLCVPAIFIGWNRNAFLLSEWFVVINPNNKEWIIEAENGPSSLVAMIPVYITDTIGVLPVKRNFINLPFKSVFIILNIIRLLFVALTLFFLRMPPFRSITDKRRLFWERSYLFIAVPLLFPHQQRYAFVFMAPALIYIAWYLVTNWSTLKQKYGYLNWTLLFLVLIHFTPLIGRDIISSYVYELFLHYRVLTSAGIALVIVLYCFEPPFKLEEIKPTNIE